MKQLLHLGANVFFTFLADPFWKQYFHLDYYDTQ